MAFEAIQKAQRALIVADEAKQGARSNYRALAEMTQELRAIRASVHELSEQFGRLVAQLSSGHPSTPREKMASAEDLMREITGSHKLPSDPAAAIVGRGLFGLVFRGVRRVLPAVIVGVIVTVASGGVGWLLRDCSVRAAPSLHSR